MTRADTIWLRFRGRGHARFQLPDGVLRDSAVCERLRSGLLQIEGIYRVDCYARQDKLSVRYIETICSYDRVAESVSAIVSGTAGNASETSCCAGHAESVDEPAALPLGAVATTGALTPQARVLSPPIPTRSPLLALGNIKEATVVEFLNDALVLFLIKLHWHMITQHWLRQPWRYRYEWMAAVYLIYLLVRSRRPKV